MKLRFLENLTGFKRLCIAWLLGAFASLSLPPLYAIPVLLVSFPALIILLRQTTTKWQAFFTGWAFGFGYFVISLYWITFSLFVDFATWWWAIPFIVAGLPGYLAVYPGFAALTFVIVERKIKPPTFAGIVLFAVLWSAAAWLRGHLCSGFPWNLEGYVWVGVLPVLQSTAWIGAYGLTFLTILWACLPLTWRADKKLSMGAVALLLIIFALGAYRLNITQISYHADKAVRIVQPSILQKTKWRADLRIKNLRTHGEMTVQDSTLDQPITHVIWPETAITFILDENPGLSEDIASWLPDNATLIAGTYRKVPEMPNKAFYNSVVVINGYGRVLDYFDKYHLVPWGEYVPYPEYIPIQAIASDFGLFVPGNGPYTSDLENTPAFSPLVCYEVISPGAVTNADNRPEWLINVTNDAWFGHTAGPHQHLAQSRTRAVEEGLPLARAASTGISAMVDPYGRVVKKLGMGEVGIIDARLPKPLAPTFYSQHSNFVFAFMLGLAAIWSTIMTWKRRKNTD